MKNKITYLDLFRYLVELCDFKENGSWTCFGDLTFTAEFCIMHDLDFADAKKKLNKTGGYCDCEVLWNSKDRISPDEVMK